MIQPIPHDPARKRKGDDNSNSNQQEELSPQFKEKLPPGSSQNLPDSHLPDTSRTRKHNQNSQSHTRDKDRQYRKKRHNQPEHFILSVLLVKKLVEKEIIIAGIREITFPHSFDLFHEITRVTVLHNDRDITLFHPTQFLMQGKQDRRKIFVKRLLMIILHDPDNLHRLIDGFDRQALPQSGIGRFESQRTDSRFVQDDLINISPVIFGKTTAGNELQIISFQKKLIAVQHLQQARLLRHITFADDGQEVGYLRSGNCTRNRHRPDGGQ